jgi:hypothetical protein
LAEDGQAILEDLVAELEVAEHLDKEIVVKLGKAAAEERVKQVLPIKVEMDDRLISKLAQLRGTQVVVVLVHAITMETKWVLVAKAAVVVAAILLGLEQEEAVQ